MLLVQDLFVEVCWLIAFLCSFFSLSLFVASSVVIPSHRLFGSIVAATVAVENVAVA